MAAAAIPIGASLVAPEVAGALGSTALGASLASSAPWLLPAVAGAGMSGIGSLLTGQNPLKGALLGGLTSGIGSAIFPQGLGGLFDSSASAAGNVAGEATSPALNSAMNTADTAATTASGVPSAASGFASKVLPYAALAGGATLLDQNNKLKQVGPAMPAQLQSRPVAPLARTQQSVDPNSYLSAGGNRSYFNNINPQVQYLAKGGQVMRPQGLGSATRNSGILANPNNTRPTPYPVMGTKKGVVRYYDDGGSASTGHSTLPAGLGMIRGNGDGRSDSIPAQLSDGEFVMSAPVVSALGNGSNKAGAQKLDMMQKRVIQRHYKGNKPKKALSPDSYVN